MIVGLILATAAAVAAPAAAGSECIKPVLIDPSSVSAKQMNEVMARAQDYLKCTSEAIDARRAASDVLLQQAKDAAEEGNAIVADVNAFIIKLREYQEHGAGRPN